MPMIEVRLIPVLVRLATLEYCGQPFGSLSARRKWLLAPREIGGVCHLCAFFKVESLFFGPSCLLSSERHCSRQSKTSVIPYPILFLFVILQPLPLIRTTHHCYLTCQLLQLASAPFPLHLHLLC